MKRFTVLIGSSVTLSIILMAVAYTPAISQQPPARTTITVFDPQRTDFQHEINEGKEGFSSGDSNLFIEKVRDPDTCDPAGKVIGRFVFVRRISENNGRFIVDFTYDRNDGTIVGYGSTTFEDFEAGFAITGGTDTYKDASGEVTFEEPARRCEKRGALVTFDLSMQP